MAWQRTSARQRTMEEAGQYPRSVHAEARSRLKGAGIDLDPEPHFQCLLCDCGHFTFRPGGRCGTPGCGHGCFAHDLPT